MMLGVPRWNYPQIELGFDRKDRWTDADYSPRGSMPGTRIE
jgi:hypothetical protein